MQETLGTVPRAVSGPGSLPRRVEDVGGKYHQQALELGACN